MERGLAVLHLAHVDHVWDNIQPGVGLGLAQKADSAQKVARASLRFPQPLRFVSAKKNAVNILRALRRLGA